MESILNSIFKKICSTFFQRFISFLLVFGFIYLCHLNSIYAYIQVVNVVPGSVAEKIGIKNGDIILELNGQKIGSNLRVFLMTLYKSMKNREKIFFKILRDSQEINLFLDPSSTLYNYEKLGIVLKSQESGFSRKDNNLTLQSATSVDPKNIKYYIHLTKNLALMETLDQGNFINVLTGVILYNGKVYFLGYHDPKYKTGLINYEKLLSEALNYPNPSLSIDPLEEEEKIKEIDRELSREFNKMSSDLTYGVQKLTELFLKCLNDPKNKDIIKKKLSKYNISEEDIQTYLAYQRNSLKLNSIDAITKAYLSFHSIYSAAFMEEGYSEIAPAGIASLWQYSQIANLKPDASANYLLQTIYTLNIDAEYEAIKARYLQKEKLTDKDYADFAKEITALIYRTLLTHLKVPSSQIDTLINQAMYLSLNKGYLDDTQLVKFINQKELEIMRKFFMNKILEVIFIEDIRNYFSIPSIFSQIKVKNLDKNTEMFKILFLSDVSLKNIRTDVGNIESFLEFAYKKGKLNYLDKRGSIGFTIIPKEANVYKISDNFLYFGQSDIYINVWNRTKIYSKETEMLIKEYEKYLNSNLNYIKERYPYIHKISEVQKILAIARYIRDHNIKVSLNPFYQESNFSVPDSLETYSYGIFFYNPEDKESNIFFNIRGGVDFSEIDKHFNLFSSNLKTSEVKERLAASLTLSEQALNEALNGDLEKARVLAEQAFQTLSFSQNFPKVLSISEVDLSNIRDDKIPEIAAFNAEILRIFNEIHKTLSNKQEKSLQLTDPLILNLQKLISLVKQYKQTYLYTAQSFNFNQLIMLSSPAKPTSMVSKPLIQPIIINLALMEASKNKPLIDKKSMEILDKVLEWHIDELKSSVTDLLTEKTGFPFDKIDKALSIGKLLEEAVVDPVMNFLEDVSIAIRDETKWEELSIRAFKSTEESEKKIKKEAVRMVAREYIERIPKLGGLLGKFFSAEETARDIVEETR